jgi:hypothetical protein
MVEVVKQRQSSKKNPKLSLNRPKNVFTLAKILTTNLILAHAFLEDFILYIAT